MNAAPVLNMLSATDHPLQALADLLTIKQLLGRIEGVKIAFIGEAQQRRRARSPKAARLLGAEFVIASPAGYRPRNALAIVRSTTRPKRSTAPTSSTPTSGCRWAARTATSAARAFEPYQVDEALMARAPNAWFMHCLPARRGEEVTAPVIDGPRSAVWRQAENRMHTARGAMLWMLEQPDRR